MKLGSLTTCLPDRSLEEITDRAAAEGYAALPVAACTLRPMLVA